MDMDEDKKAKKRKTSTTKKATPYEIAPLSPETFRTGVLAVLATNVPDYAKQAAELLNCDPVKDRAMIDEVCYHNQVIQLGADVVEKALDEELNEAYTTLQNACFFSDKDYAYIKQLHGEEAGSEMPAYIHLRLSQVEDLAPSIDFLGAIYSAEVYAQSDPTAFSSYDADEVKHKINTYEDMLTPEQKAKANYIASKMFYLRNATTKTSADGSEEECLDKVLQFTSDYKLIAYADSRLDKKAAKQQAKEEKKQARLAKKREQEAQKYTYENRNKSWLDIPGRIFANIIGILFFLPMYVLNKLLGRFLPPFVLYWLAAIVAVFGVYQMVFSLIPQPFSSTFQEAANTAMQHIQSFDTEIEKMYSTDNMTVTDNKTAANESVEYDIAQTSLTMMKSSAVMFYAFLKSIDVVMNKGILLQYLLGFAASMLVIPAFRFIGKTLTIFAVISYFLLPLIAYSQSRLIDYAFTLNEVNLTAAAVTFLVYVYPVILFFVVLYISSALVPDKETRREVLP